MPDFKFALPFLVFLLALSLPGAAATDYYVSPGGSDAGGNGSQARPWRTIQRAADVMAAGDTCHVANGEYAEMVRPARDGAPGQYVSFVADGSSVRLTGARQITGWTRHNGNIWRASVSWTFDELFVDGQRMVLARWPNLTTGDIYRPNFYQATANGGKNSIIDATHLTQPAGYWNGAKIFLVAGWGWTAEQRDVSGYDAASHRISFASAIEFSEYYDADQYSLYFLYDNLSLLDAPSEWYLDRASGIVYLWLPAGDSPNGHNIEASGGSGGFDLRDRSYIRIAGFNLMSGDIKMLDATGCRVEEVRHLFPAAELAVSGSDNLITRSEIAYASLTGVNLAGTGNTLSQCHVHHCDYLGRIFHAIVMLGNRSLWPSGGSRNSIIDCSLHDTGRDGVNTIGGQDMSDCLIEHNEIYNAGLIAKDLAGFYSSTTNGGGTVIRYNIVHDIWPKESPQFSSLRLGSGIYFDVTSSGFVVHHNLIYRTAGYAIHLNGPRTSNTLFYNNTAVASGGGWGDAIQSAGQVDGTVLANNLAVILDGRKGWDNQLGWCINFSEDVPAYRSNGYYNPPTSTRLNNKGLEGTAVVGNPLFTNAANNDFSLLAGSPMIDKGAVIPGITDGYLGAAPDIGAFERGGSVQPGPRDKWWQSTMHTIQLNRAALNFGAGTGSTTAAQSVLITSSGTGTLNWTGIPSAAWITTAPSNGTGAAKIAIGVNPAGLGPGTYSGTVAFTDPIASNSPQIVTVNLTVFASGGTAVPFGDFATPIDGTPNVTGAIPVTGWVLDDIQVTKVGIWRDPVFSAGEINSLHYIGDGLFVEGARPDIETGYPSYPFHYAAGWGYMLLTNFLPNQGNGTYTLYAIATDMEGNQVTLGSKTITCSNATAVKPFGTIDTPAQGGEASGNRFVNFGWVLTPMPKTVPKDGHLITVYVDSVPLGNLSTPPNLYNAYRPDVSNNFPGLMNTGGPGAGGPVGAFYLDTTAFANGVHTIWWIAYDNDGQGDGIGSRYFSIANVTGAPEPAPVARETAPDELSALPISFSPVPVKTGFDLDAGFLPTPPDANGVVRIEIPEVNSLVIELGGDPESTAFAPEGRHYSGYVIVGNELRPLPVGSALDGRTGRFAWMPGPGFVGTYDLVFILSDGSGPRQRMNFRLTIEPKHKPRRLESRNRD